MDEREILYEKKQKIIITKLKSEFYSNISKEKQSKNGKNKISNKRIKKERENENNIKKKKEIFENIYFNNEKNKKNKILKIGKISTTKFNNNFIDENYFKYSKNGKTKVPKNEVKYNLEENSKENKRLTLDKNKNKIKTNIKIIEFEDDAQKKLEYKIYTYKKYNTAKIKYIFNKIYINLFYLFIFYNSFFSKFTKPKHRKIELAYSHIKLKTNGNSNIKIYSEEYEDKKPDIIIINKINYTNNNIRNNYNFDNTNME